MVTVVSAKRGSIWTGAGLAVSGASTLATSLVIVAATSPAVYADVAVVTFLVFLVSLVLRLGADNVFVGEVSHADSRDGAPAASRLGARLLASAVLCGCVGAVLLWTGALAFLFDHAIRTPLTGYERGAVGLWLAADVVRLVCSEAHRARSRFVLAAVGGVGVRAPLYLLVLLGAELFGSVDRRVVFTAAAAASVVTLLAALPSATRIYPWWRTNPFRGLRERVGGHALVLLTTLSASLVGGADVWIISDTFSAEKTARYALAVAVVSGLAMISSAVAGGLAPSIARFLAQRQVAQAQSLTVRFVRLAALAAVVGWGAMIACAQPLAVRVGGSSYSELWVLVLVLGLGHVAGMFSGIGGVVLILGQQYSAMATVMVGSAGLAVGLEAVAAYGVRSVLLVSCVSACATFAIHALPNAASARRIGLRTDAFASRAPGKSSSVS